MGRTLNMNIFGAGNMLNQTPIKQLLNVFGHFRCESSPITVQTFLFQKKKIFGFKTVAMDKKAAFQTEEKNLLIVQFKLKGVFSILSKKMTEFEYALYKNS